MQVKQYTYQNDSWKSTPKLSPNVQWLLAFGDRRLMQTPSFRKQLQETFPNAEVIGCTTSGEIENTTIHDDSMVCTAIEFEKTSITIEHINIHDHSSSKDAGEALARRFNTKDLKHFFVISDGQKVNGTELVEGIIAILPNNVIVTGGLAGDADRFQETVVWHNDKVESGLIIGCAIYGDAIQIGHGSMGGWDTFGPARLITRSSNNILFELDDQNALALYKRYLGTYASELPASALLFPLAVSPNEDSEGVVRTILNINEDDQSMTFAGNMQEGHYARLMKANFERLIDGAHNAAEHSLTKLSNQNASFSILISCVGRRLVLSQRAEEELESVKDVLGDSCIISGFYSYGEISPLLDTVECQLHNQTMTITTFSEC